MHTILLFAVSIKPSLNYMLIIALQRENILTIPNLLCLTRIALTPVIAYYLLYSEHTVALALLGVAGATDMVSICSIRAKYYILLCRDAIGTGF